MSWWPGFLNPQLTPGMFHARPAPNPARSDGDGAALAGGLQPLRTPDFVRGGVVTAGDCGGAAGLGEGVIDLQAARGERTGAAVKAAPKVWLHPRITDRQARALAADLRCRLTWKGRGVALVPLSHG